MAQEFLELNDAEQAWLAQLLTELAERGVDPLDIDGLGAYYDAAYAAWAAGDPETREDPNAVVNRTGAGMGEYLRSRLPVQWTVVSDEYGTDLALHGQPGDVVMAPMSMLGKRWPDGTTGFIPGLAASLISFASEAMAPTSPPPKRGWRRWLDRTP